MMYVPHDVDEIPTKVMHAIGVNHPGSVGIFGGYPSSTNQFTIKRGTNIREMLAASRIPSELDDIDGELELYTDSIVKRSQGSDDVYRVVAMGGGGYLDPLERDPERVRRDIENLVVTPDHARQRYGVVLAPDGSVDDDASSRARQAIRDERRATSAIPSADRFAATPVPS